MGYSFGHKSEERKKGLHPDLVRVFDRAIEITEQDFSLSEGLRTKTRQRTLMRTGKSKTMNSRHLTGHAGDLIPYVGRGKQLDWEDWEPFFRVAEAVRQAAKELGVAIRWGGNWTRVDNTTAPMKDLVQQYMDKRRRQGKSSFPDLPHFELLRKVYPA